MTYYDLLEKTDARKAELIEKYNADEMFRRICDADINKFAAFLYKPFLEELVENMEEIYNNAEDDYEARMIFSVYSRWEDGDLTYEELPGEARIDI